MFIITVVDTVIPEYCFIREDKWGTPVRSPLIETAKVFENREQVLSYIEQFQLGSTSHEHQIVKLSSTDSLNDSKIIAKTSFLNNGKGKFLVAFTFLK